MNILQFKLGKGAYGIVWKAINKKTRKTIALKKAYDAFKKTKQGQGQELIDGLTPDQRFFLSYAQIWRENIRPEALASRIMTDPHSPGILRVNVPLTNLDAWYKAFSIQPGDKLYRPDSLRARIW